MAEPPNDPSHHAEPAPPSKHETDEPGGTPADRRTLSDPELDQLVRELNRGGGSSAAGAARAGSMQHEGMQDGGMGNATSGTGAPGGPGPHLEPPRRVLAAEGEPLERLLAAMVRLGASDLLLVSGLGPVARIDGELAPLGEALERAGDSSAMDSTGSADSLTASLAGSEIASLFRDHLDRHGRETFARRGATDFTVRLRAGATRADEDVGGGWRFRVNLHRQRGEPAAAVRALPRTVPTLEQLRLPARLAELVQAPRGLVLLCGPTGAGKTSTLAALVGEINRTRARHVITIEDPVEYEHASNRSVIEQVEIGRDSPSFAEALRAALRQDPDILQVGEMRDLETVATAVSAAETGHLVLATVHTNDAVQAIHRLVDAFPATQQNQIRHQLALALSAVVVQQLVPRRDGGGRVPAVELLLATSPVRHHIRSEQLQKIYNEITLGQRLGMLSMEASLARLVRDGTIDVEEARARAGHPDELEHLLAP